MKGCLKSSLFIKLANNASLLCHVFNKSFSLPRLCGFRFDFLMVVFACLILLVVLLFISLP